MTVSLVKDRQRGVGGEDVEEHSAPQEVRGATCIDPPEYCEDEATVQLDRASGCARFTTRARRDADPDEGRDMERDYWLDDMGE